MVSNNKAEPRVSISYVREDSEQVQKLQSELNWHGIPTWLDRNDLAPGERWKDSIREAIHSGNFFLSCFSNGIAITRRDKTVSGRRLLEPKVATQAAEPLPVN